MTNHMRNIFRFSLVLYWLGGVYADNTAWTTFALTTQRSLLSSFTIDKAPLVATHNSYSSAIYDSIFQNQNLSLTAQLELGVRWFELDTHYVTNLTDTAAGPYRICHASSDIYNVCQDVGWEACNEFGLLNYGADTGCLPGTPNYQQLFGEIAAWKQKNPDEIVVLYFDDAISQEEIATVVPNITDTFNGWLSSSFGNTIYSPSDLAADGGSWPTIATLVARGKTLIMTSSHPTYGNTYVFPDFRGFVWPASKIMYFSGYPSCTSTYSTYTGAVSFAFFQEDLSLVELGDLVLSNGTATVGAFNPNNALGVLECQYTIFLDYISAEHAELVVWSWDLDQPSKYSCASLNTKGRWVAENCYKTLNRFACRSNTNPHSWQISAVASARDNYNTSTICPAGYSFSTPRTARENLDLIQAVSAQNIKGNVWISYNEDANGTWTDQPSQAFFEQISSSSTTQFSAVAFILVLACILL